MAFRTKRLPLITRLRSALEFYVQNESRLLSQTFFELSQLLFRLFMVCLFVFNPRLQATLVLLQLSYLTFERCSLFQGKQKTLANYVRYGELPKSVPGNIDQAHERSFANAVSDFESSLRRSRFGNEEPAEATGRMATRHRCPPRPTRLRSPR